MAYLPSGNPSLSPRDEAELSVRCVQSDTVVVDLPLLQGAADAWSVALPRLVEQSLPVLRPRVGGKHVRIAALARAEWDAILALFSDVPALLLS